MIIPIRCFTCGKVLADKWEYYDEQVNKLTKLTKLSNKDVKSETDDDKQSNDTSKSVDKSFEQLKTGPILDKLGLKRMCCRRHFIGHIDLMEII